MLFRSGAFTFQTVFASQISLTSDHRNKTDGWQTGRKTARLGRDGVDNSPFHACCVAICRISHLGWRLLVWWLPFIGGHAFEDWPGGFGVLVAGGCGDGEVFWSCLMSPTGIFFVLVAAGAESGAIVPVGGATVAVWGGMVGVFNTCIAVWSPTGVVSQGDHLSQVDWEVSCLGVHGHQSTIPRSSKEPAEENCSVGIAEPSPGQYCGDGTVAGNPGRRLPLTKQGLIGHHDVD